MDFIDIESVRKLTEKTKFGMLDCKKALIRYNGDMGKAENHLREVEYYRKLCSLITYRKDY